MGTGATLPGLVTREICCWSAAAIRCGADVAVAVRLNPKVKVAIADICDDGWTAIEYTDAIYDETTGQRMSRAEVAEIGFSAFSSRKAAEQIAGRLVVRRIPDLNTTQGHRQATLFDVWRFYALFTTTTTTTDADAVTADKIHWARHHRAGLWRRQRLHPGSSAFGTLQRQRRLTGAGRHRVQPRPGRGRPHRASAGQVAHRDHPPHAHHPCRHASRRRPDG